MIRIASGLLAIALTAGAAVDLWVYDPSRAPDALAYAALNNNPPEASKAVLLYTEALRRDAANPYRWTDLGSAFEAADDITKARYCYHRALELSGGVPQIWLRDANFHFQMDDLEDALGSAARVLKVVPDYDAVLFGYFDRFGLSTAAVLSQIGDDRRAIRAYTQYLIQNREMDPAVTVWDHATAKGFSDDPLTASYLDALLAARRYSEARRDWVRYLGKERAGDYPDRNLLFNAGFEKEPTGSVFDWRIQRSQDFETIREASAAHEGDYSLHIRFHGTGNVSYGNVIQEAYVVSDRYFLQAWIRTERITTNECPEIEIRDAEVPARLTVTTEAFCGTTGWKLVSRSFTVPSQTNLLAIGVVRHPSQKFDNKVDGSFWIDALRLLRE
jgi:tetratricopeptide (TPR) repeat protein